MQEDTTVLNAATEKVTNSIVTENGDKAFEFEPHNSHLEYFSKIGPTKGKGANEENPVFGAPKITKEHRIEIWNETFLQNPVLAMKLLFYSRDPRNGAKIRSLFRDIAHQGAKDVMVSKFILANISRFPEYGRWDDLKTLMNTPIWDEALVFWGNAIKEGNHLACKWAPRKGRVATALARSMKCTNKQFRSLIVEGTNNPTNADGSKGVGVIETYACENMGKTMQDWDPANTPGIAFQINANGGSDIGDHSVNFAIILDYDTPV